MSGNRLAGRCMCGACRFTAIPQESHSGVCHCSMCRRWSGGTFIAVDCGDTVVFENEDVLGTYVSSAWGERLFCRECGSTLLWRARETGGTAVSIQCFDDPSQFPLVGEIFVDDKPEGYAFAGDLTRKTGAEVMAQFAPKEN